MTIASLTPVVLSILLAAGEPPGYVARRWQKDMVESTRLLQSKDYSAALGIVNRVKNEMLEMLGPGEDATRAFSIVLVHKALAHAGLGENEEALWYWYSATSLNPKLLQSDISTFGPPGEFLKQHLAPDYEKLAVIGMPDIQPP